MTITGATHKTLFGAAARLSMPGPAADLAQNPFALLSLIAAPAVLTNAASVLALSTSNRFLRASERMRALSMRTEDRNLSHEVRALLLRQADRTERQAVLLLKGLRAAYVALGSFASASLISILGAAMAGSSLHFGFHALERAGAGRRLRRRRGPGHRLPEAAAGDAALDAEHVGRGRPHPRARADQLAARLTGPSERADARMRAGFRLLW